MRDRLGVLTEDIQRAEENGLQWIMKEYSTCLEMFAADSVSKDVLETKKNELLSKSSNKEYLEREDISVHHNLSWISFLVFGREVSNFLNNRSAELSSRLSSRSAELNDRYAELNNLSAELSSRYAELSHELSEQKDQTKEKELLKKMLEISAQEKEISARKEEISAQEKEISARKEEISARKEEISARKEEIFVRHSNFVQEYQKLHGSVVAAAAKEDIKLFHPKLGPELHAVSQGLHVCRLLSPTSR